MTRSVGGVSSGPFPVSRRGDDGPIEDAGVGICSDVVELTDDDVRWF